MDINRANYEEWMMDYIEGTLNAFEVEEVRNFLESNPDLRSELDEFELFTVEPSDANFFNDKLSLKKNRTGIEGISRNEYLFIQKAEGLLYGSEKQEYDVLMSTTPEAEKEQQRYNNTILSAEKSIVYPNKQNLKRVTLLPFITKDIFNKAASISIIILVATSIWATFKFDLITPSLTVAIKQPAKTELPVSTHQQEIVTKDPVIETEEVFVADLKPAEANDDILLKPELLIVNPRDIPVLSSITGKGLSGAIKTVELSGYEIALNEIMPLYISSLQNNEQQFAIKPVQTPSFKKTNPLLAGGVNIINRITGNSLQFNKKQNEQGDVVAYRFATPNLQIDHKVKK